MTLKTFGQITFQIAVVLIVGFMIMKWGYGIIMEDEESVVSEVSYQTEGAVKNFQGTFLNEIAPPKDLMEEE